MVNDLPGRIRLCLFDPSMKVERWVTDSAIRVHVFYVTYFSDTFDTFVYHTSRVENVQMMFAHCNMIYTSRGYKSACHISSIDLKYLQYLERDYVRKWRKMLKSFGFLLILQYLLRWFTEPQHWTFLQSWTSFTGKRGSPEPYKHLPSVATRRKPDAWASRPPLHSIAAPQ